LYEYIREHIAPQIGVEDPNAAYRVFQFSHAQSVYLYEEKKSGASFIGKFHKNPKHEQPALNPAENEYRNLVHLRSLGFDMRPCYVVRPLGCAPQHNNFLATELLRGESLDAALQAACLQGRRRRFFPKLGALAYFFAELHNRTASDNPVDFNVVLAYFERVMLALQTKRRISEGLAGHFRRLSARWRKRGCMWGDRSVLVHGDATPPNFFFGQGREVLAIDLERMQWSDRLFDVGRLCGELKHAFYLTTGDPLAGEPFIGHFLWEYSGRFPDQRAAFASITQRLPFYVGLNLLRIARNWWIDPGHRVRLLSEAQNNLEALP
jgi:aminoglycoside phosphotransferase (APT) family kinase protein